VDGNYMCEINGNPTATNPGGSLPAARVGSNTVWLGTPDVWFKIKNESGTLYAVPGYTHS
jgi:hypothetical protein